MLVNLSGSPSARASTIAVCSAVVGCSVLAARLIWSPGWPIAALLLGGFVIVPLGLALVAPKEWRGWHFNFWRSAVWLQLPAALGVLAATLLPPGEIAALCALPWLGVTLLVAVTGFFRLLQCRTPFPEVAVSSGLMYLAVGGVWTVLSFWGESSFQAALRSWGGSESDLVRVTSRAMGFPQIVYELTAVHFHFAGFILPLLTGMAGRAQPGLTANLATVGVIVGVPLLAVGINLTQVGYPELEAWAAWLLAGSAVLTAVLQLRYAAHVPTRLPRTLLTVSGVSLIVAMAYAALYAWGLYSMDRFTSRPGLDIGTMLPFHGAVNAVGFALAGLVGWLLISRRTG